MCTEQRIRSDMSMVLSNMPRSAGTVTLVAKTGTITTSSPPSQRSLMSLSRETGRASQISMVPRWASPATALAAKSTAAAVPSALQPLKKCCPTMYPETPNWSTWSTRSLSIAIGAAMALIEGMFCSKVGHQ